VSEKIIIVHLTSSEPVKAGKALRFAKSALSHSSVVILLLSADGVLVADKAKPTFTVPTTQMDALDTIREFIEDGGRVFIGLDDMKSLNIRAADVIAGCEQVETGYFFNILMSDQAVIMSW
jgi:predicted peroxiredoxin